MESSMCRVCLSDNIRLVPICNTNLQLVYEKLSEHLFVAESKPLMVCYLCHSRLKSSYQLMMRCCQSEQILTQMLMEGEDYRLLDTKKKSWFNDLATTKPFLISIPNSNSTTEVENSVFETTHSTLKPENSVFQATSSKLNLDTRDYLDFQPDQTKLVTKDTNSINSQVCVALKEVKVEFDSGDEASSDNFNSYAEPLQSTMEVDVANTSVKQEHKKWGPKTAAAKKESTITTKNLQKGPRKEKKKTTSNEEKRYACDECDKRFKEFYQLKDHICVHTGEKSHKCLVCQKPFYKESSMQIHMKRIHRNVQPYQCDICSQRFARKFRLLQHIKHTHLKTKKRKAQCNVCLETFEKNYLYLHKRIHTGEKYFQCDICSRMFTHKCTLQQHLMTHTGEKRFQCDICQKKFSRITVMKNHIAVIHSGVTKFQCHICQKYLSHLGGLKIHLLKHTGERKFKCDKCIKAFVTAGGLKRHSLIHTKPFTCSVCGKGFSREVLMDTHITKCHPKDDLRGALA